MSKTVRFARRRQFHIASLLLLSYALVVPTMGLALPWLPGLDAQVRYDFFEYKNRGEEPVSDGNLSTAIGFALRRPITPGSNLVGDLKINARDAETALGATNNTDVKLDLYARGTPYTFFGHLGHSRYNNDNTLRSTSTTGSTSDYSAGLLLRTPAYPLVNLQYQRVVNDSAFAGTASQYATDTWRMSSQYDLAPLHFSYDRTLQSYDYPGAAKSDVLSQRGAVTLNYPLLPGLEMTGELGKYLVDNGNSATTDSTRRLVRLTATPTRAVVASVDYALQANTHQFTDWENRTDSKALTFNVRAEILPGLAMDYHDARQAQDIRAFTGTQKLPTGDLRNKLNRVDSHEQRLGMSARLSEATTLTGTLARSIYDYRASGTSNDYHGAQLALQTALTPTTDVTLTAGQDASHYGLGNLYDTSFLGLALRDSSSATLSYGVGYRWLTQNSQVPGTALTSQHSHVVDLDALWMPSSDAALNLRLSYQLDGGARRARLLAPSVDFRWRLTPSTNLGVNYLFSQTDLTSGVNPALLVGQWNRGASVRLTHGLRNGSSVDLTYDFFRTNVGTVEWQRQVRAYYTLRL